MTRPPNNPANRSTPDWLDQAMADGADRRDCQRQSEIDALLRLESGEFSVPADLVARVRRSLWHGRFRRVLELAAAAVIVVGLSVWYVTTLRQPFQLEGSARVVDSKGHATTLVSGAWIETGEKPATLKIRGHSSVAIEPNSRLQVSGTSQDYAIFLDYGELSCQTQADVARLRIETIEGSVAPEGTECSFTVSITKGEPPMLRNLLVVSVITGMAMVATQDGIQSVAAGQDVKVAAPQPQVVRPDGGQGGQQGTYLPAAAPVFKLMPQYVPMPVQSPLVDGIEVNVSGTKREAVQEGIPDSVK